MEATVAPGRFTEVTPAAVAAADMAEMAGWVVPWLEAIVLVAVAVETTAGTAELSMLQMAGQPAVAAVACFAMAAQAVAIQLVGVVALRTGQLEPAELVDAM